MNVEKVIDERRAARKEQRARDAAEFLAEIRIGDIFYSSWGYDQTNIDWYKVVDVQGKSVWFQEIGAKRVEGSDGFMCDSCVPDVDTLVKEPFRKIVRSPWIRLTSYSGLSRWDGKPKYRSWYA